MQVPMYVCILRPLAPTSPTIMRRKWLRSVPVDVSNGVLVCLIAAGCVRQLAMGNTTDISTYNYTEFTTRTVAKTAPTIRKPAKFSTTRSVRQGASSLNHAGSAKYLVMIENQPRVVLVNVSDGVLISWTPAGCAK